VASKNIKLTTEIVETFVLTGNTKVSSIIGYSGDTSLFLIKAIITVLHAHLYQSVTEPFYGAYFVVVRLN